MATDWATIFASDVLFSERFLFIESKSGGLMRLRPNRAQLYLDAFITKVASVEPLRLLILKARQLGCSTWVQARFFRKTLTRKGVNTLTVSHEPDATSRLFQKSVYFYENLPPTLAPHRKYSTGYKMYFDKLHSELSLGTANKKTFGRGATRTNFHVSEFAFWPWAQETFGGLKESIPDTIGTDIIIESTANGATGAFYDMCKSARDGIGDFRLIFLPWWFDDAYTTPLARGEVLEPLEEQQEREEEDAIIRRARLTPEQIKWRRKKIADFKSRGRGDDFYQEYAEDADSCFLTSGKCFFDAARLRTLLYSCPEEPLRLTGPNDTDHKFYTDLSRICAIWEEPIANEDYVMGVDVGEGNPGADFSAISVRAYHSNKRVATVRGYIDGKTMGVLAGWLGNMYNKAVIGVERTGGWGISTIDRLDEDGYDNLFWDGDAAGWRTTTTTRPVMLTDLRQEVIDDGTKILDPRLLNEMLRFLRGTGSNRPDHAANENDDLLFADAIAGQLRKFEQGGALVH